MHPKDIDSLRDSALLLESINIELAYDLMKLAYNARPDGPLISRKYLQYSEEVKPYKEFRHMFNSGDIAIIPIGFRCHTKIEIYKRFDIKQPTLPFDNGFFTPQSVASILKNIDFTNKFECSESDYSVCIKLENYNSGNNKGIKFKRSNYAEINERVLGSSGATLNKFLDSTFGYYTLSETHGYVLAHYNWHPLSGKTKTNNIISETELNIRHIQEMFTNRINRMHEMCSKAKYVFFIYCNMQDYDFLNIDDQRFTLRDLSELEKTLHLIYGSKAKLISSSEITIPDLIDRFL